MTTDLKAKAREWLKLRFGVTGYLVGGDYESLEELLQQVRNETLEEALRWERPDTVERIRALKTPGVKT